MGENAVGRFCAKKAGAATQPTPRWRDFCFRPVTAGRDGWRRVTPRVTAPMKCNSAPKMTVLNIGCFAWGVSRNAPQVFVAVAARNASRGFEEIQTLWRYATSK